MRKGFGFHDRNSPFRFNPATMFSAGQKGAVYDLSDFSALFQDSTGTTPVTGVEQVVGLMLDKSGNANNATSSGAARPTLRARYNLLTYSEDFGNAIWENFRLTKASNATTAPDGTLTADSYTETAVSGTHVSRQLVTLQSGRSYTFSFYAKASTADFVNTNFTSSSNNYVSVEFDVSNGTVNRTSVLGTWTLTSVTVTSAGNDWYRCVVTFIPGAAATAVWINMSDGVSAFNSDGQISYLGSTGNTVFLWGAQLLTAADVAVTGNAYQRVAAASNYDTSNSVWKSYLAFGGAQSMSTGSIDFTATDAVTVFAGLTKLSDAAQGVVAELSADIASNNGTFLLSAPNSAAANYNFSSKGTTQVDNTVTTYTAPHTAVLTGIADIAAPSNILRVNGAVAGTQTGSQGTGNFGNYALNIGARDNGVSLPFNGRLYGLIVLGAQATDWQIWAAEQWMAQRTGISF